MTALSHGSVRIAITKSRSGHYTATAILGSFRRSEGKLDNLVVARAAARELSTRVWSDAVAARVVPYS